MSEYISKCSEVVGISGKTLIVPDYIDTSKEIVRCRDCKHGWYRSNWQTDIRFKPRDYWICKAEWCTGFEGDHPEVQPDGFCAWGERKDEE